ncbi:hypothetical protein [Botrimarina mediterranea]|uniref:Uncharacterized protein n=1 Tax=Botrimarina mediterranea TaxID=2528022 RepID=A0A518K4Z8_9BACT|nr:hypothetical protein [Botrimarina mediterranea]QDV72872.1 hypothetical protein Spa11_10560 [Botrimarina mediterranea]QDV77445.1 hypothetical protein K2D_10380 [Planctomycetes bacterium K2D]
MRYLLALLLSVGLFSDGVATTCFAADFRIETRVYAKGEEEPASQSVTLFTGGAAYDFRDEAHRVTIFRPGAADKPGRFVLLDSQRQYRSEIGGDRVAVVTTKLRRWAAVHKDPFLRFTGDPAFDEAFDADTGELRMTSKQMSYRLVTMPVASREAMKELRAFLDAYAQLHTLLEAGLPPGPRMRVNESLANHDVVPIEVELYEGPIEGEPELRAEHLVTWILSREDRNRIEEANRWVAEYVEVENTEFSKFANQRMAEAVDKASH